MKLTKLECSAIISAALWKPVMVVTQTETEFKAIKEQLTSYIKMNDRLWNIFDRQPSRYDIFLNGFSAIKIIDRASLKDPAFSGLILLYGFGNVLHYPDWIFAPNSEIYGLDEYVKRSREVFGIETRN